MLPLFSTDRTAGLIFAVSYLAWFVCEIYWSIRYAPRGQVATRDRNSRYAIVLSVVLGVGAGFVFVYAAPSFGTTWGRSAIFYTGILLVWAGLAFRLYAIRVLGKYFTVQVAVQEGQTVVEAGPYRWIRHPAYSGTLVTLLGLGLAMTNWLSLVCMMVCTVLGYSYRVQVEEQALVEALGAPYREYMQRTRRFIPFLY